MAIKIHGSGLLEGVTSGLTSAAMPTGSVLQVVQTHLTTEVAMTGNDWDDVAGLTIAITPSSASSKILFMTSIDWAGGTYARIKFAKKIGSGSYNDLPLPTVDGNRSLGHLTHNCYNNESDKGNTSFIYLDSPSTTDEVTYKTMMYGTGRVNFPGNGGNSTTYTQGVSNLLAWEVKG